MSDAIVSRWVRCTKCGGVAEWLATQLGCTNNDAACRNWSKAAREAWAKEGYPDPSDPPRDVRGQSVADADPLA